MPKADSVFTPPINTSAITPIAGLDWLDIAADAKPADIFRAIGRLRKEAREEIDRLIRFLDETENHMCVDDEDGGDDEPSLGSRDHYHSQELWAAGGHRDLEEDLAESGIADHDGLLEQMGRQDWQTGVMA
jgi:hypothetical protein